MRKIIQKILYGNIFFAAALMPFSITYANIALAVLLGTTILSFFTCGIYPVPLKRAHYYLFSPLILFLPVFIGVFYSPIDLETIKEVKRMIFLFLLPALALRKDMLPLKAIKWAANGLITGAILSAMTLLCINIYKITGGPITVNAVFNYNHTHFNFTEPLDLHPTYLGSYYLMAWFFLFFQPTRKKNWIRILGSFILFPAILFLNARIIYGLFFLILLIYVVTHFSWKLFLFLVVIISAVSFLSFPYIENTYIYEKMTKGTKWELTQNIGTYSTDQKYPSDSRLSRWMAALDLFKERPLFGSGTGTEQSLLNREYKKRGMRKSLKMSYNTHNQFIGFMVEYGAFGLILMLIYFVGNFYITISKKRLDFFCFLILISGIFFVENYLERNSGIIFLSFFGTLFYLRCYPYKIKN